MTHVLQHIRLIGSACWRQGPFPKKVPTASAYGYQQASRHQDVVAACV